VWLFGLNDAAVQRIRRFAESHRCHTLFDGRRLIFRKTCLSNGPV